MGFQKDGKIYINLNYQDGTAQTMATVLSDELSHYVDYKQGKRYDETRQDISTAYGNNGGKQTQNYVSKDSGNGMDKEQLQEQLAEYDYSGVNALAGAVPGGEREPLEVFTPGTDLFGKGQTYDKKLMEEIAKAMARKL